MAKAQKQVAVYTTINSNTNGYYEYLPQGYESGNARYPLILFIHGTNELGPGNPATLPNVLRNGLPKLISQGQFPTSFTVNGRTFRYIVISPQFVNWPQREGVKQVLEYVKSHYRVDTNRIYLTGISMGGGLVWEYAGNPNDASYAQGLAAIVPVCGASWPEPTRAKVIAKYKVPVWAFHNSGDETVPLFYTEDYVNEINKASTLPDPLAKETIFNVTGHDAWTKAYDPAYKEDNMNVYEWMLQFSLGEEAPLPVILSDYNAISMNSDKVLVSWSTSFEQNNAYFTIERSMDGTLFKQLARIPATNSSSGGAYSYTDENPVGETEYYRLSQTDADGKTTWFRIIKVNSKESVKNTLAIYPNPADTYIDVILENAQTGQLRISLIDQNGRIVHTELASKQQTLWKHRVPVTRLQAGYYTVKVRELSGKNFASGFIKR